MTRRILWWPLLALATPLADCDGTPTVDGGAAEVLVVADVAGMALCGDYLYWTGRSCNDAGTSLGVDLNRMSVDGGATDMLASAYGAYMACDSNYLYFWDGAQQLSRLDLANDTVETLTTARVNMTGSIAVNTNGVFWVDVSGAHTVVDGGVVDIATIAANEGLAADQDHLFFGFHELNGDAGIMAVVVDGSAPTAAWEGQSASAIALSSRDLWWLAQTASGTTSLVKMPRDGGAAVTLIADAGNVFTSYANSLIVDSEHVYWLPTFEEVSRVALDGSGLANVFNGTSVPAPLNHTISGIVGNATSLFVGIDARDIPPNGPTICGGIVRVPK